ncbi:MAG: hypothetical protein LCI02_25285 [Proteobacteria bacterium]|nr:hypothetical protein [Pseudomonadota bacterium]
MGNVARPAEVKAGKQAASQILTTLLLRKRMDGQTKGEAGQDLQEIYRVVDSDSSSAMGDYWLKLTRGRKVLSDEVLARVAHEAVANGQITHEDYPLLKLSSGGSRLLQIIGNLLIESHSGVELDSQKVDRNLRSWQLAHFEAKDRRVEERDRLRSRLKAVSEEVTSALRATDDLLEALAQTEYFEIPYRPSDPVPGTHDDRPYRSSVEQFIDLMTSLRAALADGAQAASVVSVQEADLLGFADIPRVEPQCANLSESLKALSAQTLELIAVEWDDDDTGEIVLEDVGDVTEPLPGTPVRLLWIRPAQDESSS